MSRFSADWGSSILHSMTVMDPHEPVAAAADVNVSASSATGAAGLGLFEEEEEEGARLLDEDRVLDLDFCFSSVNDSNSNGHDEHEKEAELGENRNRMEANVNGAATTNSTSSTAPSSKKRKPLSCATTACGSSVPAVMGRGEGGGGARRSKTCTDIVQEEAWVVEETAAHDAPSTASVQVATSPVTATSSVADTAAAASEAGPDDDVKVEPRVPATSIAAAAAGGSLLFVSQKTAGKEAESLLNATNPASDDGNDEIEDTSNKEKGIDTALTGDNNNNNKNNNNNSVQVHANAIVVASVASTAPTMNVSDDNKNNRADGSSSNTTTTTSNTSRKTDAVEERDRLKRDRNRVHARNTRNRKLAMLNELKRQVLELSELRDAEESERARVLQSEMEHRQVRFQVLEQFLKLRGTNETSKDPWDAILEDGFTFTLPVTSSFDETVATTTTTTTNDNGGIPEKSIILTDHVLHGVGDTMEDSALFATFLQGLGSRSNNVSEEQSGVVTFHYKVDPQTFFMDGCTCALDWDGVSVGAMNKGADSELKFKGSLRGTFNPDSNKLLSAVMTFDTGIVFAQLLKLDSNRLLCDDNMIAHVATAITGDTTTYSPMMCL